MVIAVSKKSLRSWWMTTLVDIVPYSGFNQKEAGKHCGGDIGTTAVSGRTMDILEVVRLEPPFQVFDAQAGL